MNKPDQDGMEQDQFEDQLTAALRHVDAPAGFQQRVLARMATDPQPAAVIPFAPRVAAWPRRWYAIAAMLLVAVMALSAGLAHRAQEHRRHAENERKFLLALEVQRETMAETRQQLRDAGVQLEP